MLLHVFRSGELWAAGSAVFWAIAVVLFKKAGDDAPPLVLNLFKNVVALACFVPIVLFVIGRPWPTWSSRTWLMVAASGVIGITLTDTMFFMALSRLGAGLNAVVDCFYLPSLALLAHYALGDAIGPTQVAGGALVIAAILVGAAERPPVGRSRRDIAIGVLLGISGMVGVGVGVVLIDGALDTAPVLWTTTMRLAFGTVALVPLILARRDRSSLPRLFRPSPWWRVAVPASVFGAALAMWAWLYGFAHAEIAVAGVLNQLSTAFIFVLAALFLKEPFTKRRAIAVAMAMAGALAVLFVA